MKHSIIFLSLLTAALLLLCACSGGETGGPVKDPANALIGEDGTTPYVLIRPDNKDSIASDALTTLADTLEKETGIKFKLGTDFVKEGTQFVEQEYEILIGDTNREASQTIGTELPRVHDWAIARIGSKIVIQGKNSLGDAVEYFLKHYVADGNIYIADGEKYVHTGSYELDSLSIGGVPIDEFTIYYDRTSTAFEAAAKDLIANIRDSTGYIIKTGNRMPANPEKAIIIAQSQDENNYLEHNIFLDGTNVRIESGSLVNSAEAVEALMSHIKTLGKTAVIDNLNLKQGGGNGKMNVADAKFLASLEDKANEMKETVLNTKSEYEVGKGGKIYYFAADGSDSNDGLSPEKPRKTLSMVNSMRSVLKPGDVVLFKRGDWFRGWFQCAEGATYSAYGEGDKPTICTSKQNYADPDLWIETDVENVWQYNGQLFNVGLVLFDHDFELGDYEATYGKMKILGKDISKGYEELTEDLSFWSNLNNQAFYLVSTEGNPGERFERIEIAEQQHSITVATGVDNVIIDNLRVTMTGSHGVGAGTQKNLTVRNCVFDWLGGSILRGFNGANLTRYGNAVQVFGGCDGYYVYNNWMYQIYDTAITHQYSEADTTSHSVMNDVVYYDNLIEYVFWGIEYYNTSRSGDGKRETHNVNVYNNFCRFGGMGWGCPGRETNAPLYHLGISKEIMSNYVTHDNIFDRCLGFLITHAGDVAVFQNNTYIQHYGEKFARLSGQVYNFDATALDTLATVGETSPTLWYIMEPRGGSEK